MQILAVDTGADGYHRCRVTLEDSHVVEGTVDTLERLPVSIDLYQGTRLDGIVVVTDGIQARLDIIRSDIGQESQSPHVHAENGNILMPHPAGSLQESTVTTHGDDEIGFEGIALEDM